MSNVLAVVKSGAKTFGRGVVKYLPDILGGVGVAGMVVGAVLAAKQTPKALKLIEKAEEKKGGELTKGEKVAAALPAYIPAIGATFSGACCVVGGYAILHKRLAVTAFSLAASERALTEFTEKTKEVVGEKKAEEIKDAVSAKHIADHPLSSSPVIFTGKGEHLCFDSYSGKYFKSDIESVRRAVNDFNEALLTEMTKSLGEFYDLLGIPSEEIHNNVGWDIAKGQVDVRFGSHITDTGEPCLTIEYWNEPSPDYRWRVT